MDATTISPPSRREANRLSRREAILDVAQSSFLEFGYGGTTMSGIAAQLGGSKGTLWNYFPAKQALFTAVVDRATEEFRRQLTVILNPDDGLETVLRGFCEQFLTKVTTEEAIALYRLVVGETSRFPELGRIFYARAPHQTHLLLGDFIARVQTRGLLLGIEPLRAAQHLAWLCMSGSYQMRLTGMLDKVTPEQVAADVDAAMGTFMRAYGVAECGARPHKA